MSPPLVSVLIPAFKPRWLDLAIASVFAQSLKEVEVVVSDDSSSPEIESIVNKWVPYGVRYVKNPGRGHLGSNVEFLISQAEGRYVKYLFDDDFLLPHALTLLVRACEDGGADLALHNRMIVDDNGVLLEMPEFLVGKRGYAEVTREIFFGSLIKLGINAIGEPSNVLMRTDRLREISKPFTLEGRRMRFLSDMALYLNFMSRGLRILGVPQFASAFRMHSEQNSAATSPGHKAGLYEWDLLRRWSAQHGFLSSSEFDEGHAQMLEIYGRWIDQYPELEAFVSCDAHEPYLNEEFLALIQVQDSEIDAERLARRGGVGGAVLGEA